MNEEVDSSVIPLKPTRIFWIPHHTAFTKKIRVLDLTGQTLSQFNPADPLDDAFKDVAKSAAKTLSSKSKTDAEAYRFERQNFQNTRILMFSSLDSSSRSRASVELVKEAEGRPSGQPDPESEAEVRRLEQMQLDDPKDDASLWSSGAIAHWKAPWWSTGDSSLSFPPQSRHSSHNITMSPVKWYRRTETFVKDSVTYRWEAQANWHSRRFTLTREIGGEKKEVARLALTWSWEIGTGGVVAVDQSAEGVDEAVALLGAMVIMKKKRQRDAERSSNGGGGGGGGS